MAELLCWIELDCTRVPNKLASECMSGAITKVRMTHTKQVPKDA